MDRIDCMRLSRALARKPPSSCTTGQSFERMSKVASTGMVRALYDCPDLPLGPEGMRCRLVVATHQASAAKSRIGVARAGVVYELFLTKLPQSAFTASDVVALYLHRGAFENALADEDQEQDPDRWCSHTAMPTGCVYDFPTSSAGLFPYIVEMEKKRQSTPFRNKEC
jgi:hypothetical protein